MRAIDAAIRIHCLLSILKFNCAKHRASYFKFCLRLFLSLPFKSAGLFSMYNVYVTDLGNIGVVRQWLKLWVQYSLQTKLTMWLPVSFSFQQFIKCICCFSYNILNFTFSFKLKLPLSLITIAFVYQRYDNNIHNIIMWSQQFLSRSIWLIKYNRDCCFLYQKIAILILIPT